MTGQRGESLSKEFFVNAVQLIRINGSSYVPTIVYYDNKRPLVGHAALQECADTDLLNEDFKVDLGRSEPGDLARKRASVGTEVTRSPLGLAKDFITGALEIVETELTRKGIKSPKRVLIAEPLSLGGDGETSEAWLVNYRGAVRRALPQTFDDPDFMPEPFAVFQYYRYGIRHPLVAERRRHIVLVLDFGGGTFDVSIIETTATGDISAGGKNSRPVSARSIPVGGFYVNRMIAENLLFDALDKKADKGAVRTAIDKFYQHKASQLNEFELLKPEIIAFYKNFKRLLQLIESAKIAVCSTLANWSLDADLRGAASYPVKVPRNPFSATPDWIGMQLDAERIRTVFLDRIWKQKLLPATKTAIERAQPQLGGKQISLVLLSGGSSNIRWIQNLLKRDLAADLQGAEVLALGENFQEIVAKGLAVECARRFYTGGDSEFRAVTYNRLCLALRPNDGDLEIKPLQPLSKEISHDTEDPGVLLPASSSLRGLIEVPLRWKVKLGKAPKQFLDYFFMRSSFDPEDTKNLQNVVNQRVQTPAKTSFGSSVEVQLTVRPDGTATPTFVYGHGEQGHNTKVTGTPFFLDMTFANEEADGDSYLGFDFGSSTSAFSIVTQDQVQVFKERSYEKSWVDLSDLVSILPYPLASPLASYLGESSSSSNLMKWGRETVESMLAFVAYASYMQYTAEFGANAFLKGFQHRSAGPLWALIKATASKTSNNSLLNFQPILKEPVISEVDLSVTQMAQDKHGKLAQGLKYNDLILKLGNIISTALASCKLGYFVNIRPKPFNAGRFVGSFRNARGSSKVFIETFSYEGGLMFGPEEPFLCELETGKALSLAPLAYWGLGWENSSSASHPEFYFFDTWDRDSTAIGFKAVEERPEYSISSSGELGAVVSRLASLRNGDAKPEILANVQLIRE